MYPEDENFDQPTPNLDSPPTFEFLQNPPNCPLTRSLTRLLHEQHSINFVECDLRDKLTTICEKLYKFDLPLSALKPDEQLLWSAYKVDNIMFFLTGDCNLTPQYTKFIHISQLVQHQPPPLPPHAFPQPQIAQPVVPQPQGVHMPQHFNCVDERNIIEGPRTRQAKLLAACIMYFQNNTK